MKQQRNILSSSSLTEGMPRTKPARKEIRMAELQSPEQSVDDMEEVTLKDLFVHLNSIQRNMDSSFTSMNQNMEEIKLELRHDVKQIRKEIDQMKVSLDEVRIEVEEQKSNMAKVNEDVVKMRAEISNLKHQLEQERERNIKLEQYTHRENVRLLNVKESNDEDTKQVFREVLTEMGIEITGMRFHAVHRVGPQRDQRRDTHQTNLQHLDISSQDLSVVRIESMFGKSGTRLKTLSKHSIFANPKWWFGSF